MKKLSIKFTLVLEVATGDHLDKDWVASQYLGSDRFSTLRIRRDPPGTAAFSASSRIESIRVIGEEQ